MGLSSQLAPSAIARPGVIANAAARPASPYEGQVIYETDTDKTLVWNGSAWVYLSTSTANPPGLELVKTQTIGSGVATVDVTSCFNANYDNYRISVTGGSHSNATAAIVYLLSGTTPTSSGFYFTTAYFTSGGSTLNAAAASNTAYSECGSVSNNAGLSLEFEVHAPFLAQYTRMTWSSPDNYYWRFGGSSHNASTSYDGFRIGAYAGTYSNGTIRVYGYKK